jgi:hypothetical protein
MNYRPFGETGWKASALGFGAMRLPTTESGEVDDEQAIEIMRYAIDHGVNYVDTAYPYHSQYGEIVVGKALQDGYRDKVKLATKLNIRFMEEAADVEPMFQEQLEKLQTDRIDMYLLHAMKSERWDTFKEWGVLEWAEEKKASGEIGYFGFSFHDDYNVFERMLNEYNNWDFCQIQYNYMNIDHQAGRKGLKLAADKGLAVVIMEPLLGGRLVDPPEPIQELWNRASTKRSAVEWALQWLWDQPEVSLVLSGMSNLQQVKENLEYADRSAVDILTDEERELVAQVREAYNQLCPVPCTRCGYCMPCPNDINIPGNFRILNEGVMYGEMERARNRYERMDEEARAEACIQCQICEEACPQDIPISELMPKVHAILGEGEGVSCIVEE